MQKFYVIWTWQANYSNLIRVVAPDARAAAKHATFLYGDEFHKTAKVYVFDTPPVYQSTETND